MKAIILSLCFVLSQASVTLVPGFNPAVKHEVSSQTMYVKNSNAYEINGYHSNTIRNVSIKVSCSNNHITVLPTTFQSLGAISAESQGISTFTVQGDAGNYELIFEVRFVDEKQRSEIYITNEQFTINRASRDVDSSSNIAERDNNTTKRATCAAGTSNSGNNNDIVSTFCSFAGDLNDYTTNSWQFTTLAGVTFNSFTFNVVPSGPVDGPFNRALYPGVQGGTLSSHSQTANFDVYGTGCGTYNIQLKATYKKGTSPLYTWTATQQITISPPCGCACACAGTCRRDATEGRIMPLKN